MSITDVFDKARAYGFIQTNLVTNFAQLTRLVAQADARREEEEAAWEAHAEAAAEAAWQATDPRTALQRDQDDAAAAEEAWALGL
jgi:hypothetical protein